MKFIEDLDFKKIGGELEAGLQAYIHKKIGNVVIVFLILKKYYIVEDMDTTQAFKVMRNFVLNLDQDELEEIIYSSKPFRNFKEYIIGNWDLREAWFEYKALAYQEYVKEEIEWIIEKEEDESRKQG